MKVQGVIWRFFLVYFARKTVSLQKVFFLQVTFYLYSQTDWKNLHAVWSLSTETLQGHVWFLISRDHQVTFGSRSAWQWSNLTSSNPVEIPVTPTGMLQDIWLPLELEMTNFWAVLWENICCFSALICKKFRFKNYVEMWWIEVWRHTALKVRVLLSAYSNTVTVIGKNLHAVWSLFTEPLQGNVWFCISCDHQIGVFILKWHSDQGLHDNSHI